MTRRSAQEQIFLKGDITAGTAGKRHRSILQSIACRTILERGLLLDFPPEALAELERIQEPAWQENSSTRDLDQLSVAEDPSVARDYMDFKKSR